MSASNRQPLGVTRNEAAFGSIISVLGGAFVLSPLFAGDLWPVKLCLVLSLLSTAAVFGLRYFRAEVFQRPEPQTLPAIWRILRDALALGVGAPLAFVFVAAIQHPSVLPMARIHGGLTWAFAIVLTIFSAAATITMLRTIASVFRSPRA